MFGILIYLMISHLVLQMVEYTLTMNVKYFHNQNLEKKLVAISYIWTIYILIPSNECTQDSNVNSPRP